MNAQMKSNRPREPRNEKIIITTYAAKAAKKKSIRENTVFGGSATGGSAFTSEYHASKLEPMRWRKQHAV